MRQRISMDQINYINIGLMLVSAVLAMKMPFELFLFAYAFFGPLHYLTEISWLHDRKYFTRGKRDHLPLLLLVFLITVAGFGLVPNLPSRLPAALMVLAFGSALIFATTASSRVRWMTIAALAAAGLILARFDFVASVFGVLLPTIIHVFLFTGMFILFGALKGRSVSGMASLAVFATCAVSFFVLAPDRSGYHVADFVKRSYLDFTTLNYVLMTPFRQHDLSVPANVQQYVHYVNEVLFRSPGALAVMGFIAFAYTYHYLNWFSKTSVIQWHNIPRTRFAAVIALWLASVAVYLYDYSLGLKWLFLLSFAHVLLEFPLNHLTAISIGKELKKLVRDGTGAGHAEVHAPEKLGSGR